MFHHPEQTMALAGINMREIEEEIARWRLATAVMKAQRAVSKDDPSKLSTVHTIASQFLHKLSLLRGKLSSSMVARSTHECHQGIFAMVHRETRTKVSHT